MSGALAADLRLQRGRFLLAARFTAAASGVTAVFGPSGAGKSLLFSALAGLTRIDSGSVKLGALVLDDVAARTYVPAHQRGIGLVFQDARLLPHLSVRGNLLFAQKRAAAGAAQVSLDAAAAFFDIASLLDRRVSNLSGGEKSRVALARAILSAPQFLLLDEPFAALDGARRRAFLAVLRQMSQQFQIPMMVVTHQIDDVAALADDVIGLQAGKVVAAGPLINAAAGDSFQALLDARDTGAPVQIEPRAEAPPVWVRADNVLLARSAPSGLSARYVWPARLDQLTPESEKSVLVRLTTETGPLWSRITHAAAAELDLTAGAQVWAIVKAHSL
ncbi:MAG: ATP-binding cassette domain-containing protein [Terricaulis sp.]